MDILQICAFAAPTAGNFINALLALDEAARSKGFNSIYAFPERARNTNWCIELQKKSKVYFLPEAKARILPKTYLSIKKIYKENNICIVHSHFELYDIPATVCAPKNTKVYWHLHDSLQDSQHTLSVSRKILNKLQYGFFSKNATLLSVSHKHAEYVATLGFNPDNIVYFPNGIDTSRIKLTTPSGNYQKFLLFGWDVYRKGVDIAVNAAKKVNSQDFSILVIGQQACRQFIEESKCSNPIIFSPPSDDINTLYQDSDVFLHISRSEGQSYALIEAIYAGLPVIVSNISENLFAKEFENIIWINDGSADDLAASINSLLNKSIVFDNDAVKKNRAIIEQKYSLDSWVKRTIDTYLSGV